MKKLIIGLALSLAIASPAQASFADIGTPYGLASTEYGVELFYSNGTRTGAPACATYGRFAIDTRTDGGKAMFSVLLTAIARGKRVWINGTGTCAFWGDSEGVNYIQAED